MAVLYLYGCASINYYSQSISGQFEVFQKSKSINGLLASNNIDEKTRSRLITVLNLRKFSIQDLGLPDNKSYLAYADLERNYVIWNIFATDEFSLQPKQWCYLMVGCLAYRGYFSREDAIKHEQLLKNQGYDVYLGGVAAYSTLGWFNDPVLNTMLRWNDIRLAKVMFHELAHQQLYIHNDTEFNEAYADTVALIGVRKWLQKNFDQSTLDKFEKSQRKEEEFINLIMHYKSLLGALYDSDENDTLKRIKKAALFQQMFNDYQMISQSWENNDYKDWFTEGLNNAKLASVITYRQYVPDFLALYKKQGKDLKSFYGLIKSLSKCKPMKRKEILKNREIKFEC